MTLQIGILYSRIRKDEKLLLSELRERGHEVEKIDIRNQEFAVGKVPEAFADLDLVVDRCLATSRSLYATTFFETYGIPVVNSNETAEVCADKVKNSLALEGAGVPTPATKVAFTKETAMDAIEAFGYPCVLKPVVGSWGRLMAKIDSPDAAEAILEHKATLGHYEHKVFYVQEYVEKPGRDIRVLATDGDPVAAMVRSSDHWITNAAKGAETDVFELDDEAQELVQKASDAVGGGLLGVDLMETEDVSESHSEGSQTESGQRYTVHEVNHTVEFKALDEAVETDVASAVVDWLEKKAGADDDQLEVTV
ncbi:lysine biosynthesis protein LysX [Natronobacterium gregoryi]|uniref:Lysine biosynthesis enzyme LysX n=2 Tax=Natronobacterium gregoryi TaxID=44930 RepID=L0AI24_NATGS|nr:lysine biosynthesis protein LysX [Natronobacterium gregoryi]AFZ72817.1 Lysine biosynthesis enzyme LysX [Natronobacterium gregoryi SP2]ELY69419.1 lysine biosynthesis enzyme LysX [Natronobacterium gregoryi SP2]PLK21157.1 lysine biosynthesis protein LysX [Natronobacterium gregoryi SP2]SFJ10052.1 L-2-aminoadipate N-acetyltransferase [Natronobacterium gregoryi]